MKRTIVAGCILLTVIGLCLWEMFWIKNTVEALKTDIGAIVTLVENDEVEKAVNKTEALIKVWHKKQNLISIFIDHEPLKELESSFVSMKAELEQGNTDDFFLESELSFINLHHLNSTEQPSLGNIF